jgi:ribose transport system permease protein
MKNDLKNQLKTSQITDKIGLIVALIVITIIFSVFNKNYFSTQNFFNVLVAESLAGLVAIGETYLIIAGLVDLSAGSVAAFASVLTALLLHNNINTFFVLIIVIVAGVFIGVINALAVNKFNLEPFIATLATMSIFRGLAYILCGGRPVFISNQSFINLGTYEIVRFLTVPVVILVASFIIFGIILAKTYFGRSVYVLGGNKYAARLAGLNPRRIIMLLFILNAVLAAVGGTLLAARMNSGQPSSCIGLEFDAITAAVLGGTAFSGGVGSIFGTVLGALILQGFNTGLIMLNVQIFWQEVARGMLLLIALAFDYYRKKKRDQRLLESSMQNVH